MSPVLVVLVNVPDAVVAEAIAEAIVQQRAAACVNILPAVRSVYRWEGKTEQATEVTLVIKTTQAAYTALESLVASMHPYDVPEIIALPVQAGLPAYLQWVADETQEA